MPVTYEIHTEETCLKPGPILNRNCVNQLAVQFEKTSQVVRCETSVLINSKFDFS